MLPSRCRICQDWPTQVICQACRERFVVTRPRCHACAVPLPALGMPASLLSCGTCLRHPPPLSHCAAAVNYGFPWDRLVADLKFRESPELAAHLAGLMRQNESIAHHLSNCDAVLAMPLSRQRLQERGFNQADLLARALHPGKHQAQWLLRLRHTRAQSECTLAERLTNVKHAFAVHPAHRARVQGLKLLLVDDVMTTGASLFEAARSLLQAGASEVSAVVFARTAAD